MPDVPHPSPAAIEQRKAFLELSDRDIALLRELHGLLAGEAPSFVDDFYKHLLAFDTTRQLVGDAAHLERLKRTQTAYFDRLTAGDYDAAYIEDRVRVGAAHRRVGLEPEWYLGAYSKYLSLLLPKMWQLLGSEDRRTLETTLALLRIVFLDMGIAIDTYIGADRQTIRDKSTKLAALNQIAIAISSSLGLPEVLDRIARSGVALCAAKASCIAFYDEAAQRFDEWHAHGLSDHFIENMHFGPGGLADETFISGRHIVSNDRPETAHKLSQLARDEGIRAFICLPLVSQSSRLGVFYLYLHDRDAFLPEEIEHLETFAHLAAGALENARLHAKTLTLATTDTLTGLFNRHLFDERMTVEFQRAQRYGRPVSLLMLDIDHFKKINDSYGHPAGDAVLKRLAAILREQVREVDAVARYGGEEFTVILPELDGSMAKTVGDRIRKTIAGTAFSLPDGREIGVTVSVGIACHPQCADSTEVMVKRADEALYLAKRAGRNRVFLYRELLHAELEKSPGRIAELLNEDLDNVRAVATAVNVKAPYLRDHADRVEELAVKLGRRLRLSRAEMKLLVHAAILHDLGCASVPESILNKRGPLSQADWEVIRRHPAVACDMLGSVPALRDVLPLVRHHHERFDGSGYPDGLAGGNIPRLARILAVADAYSAMTAARPQRAAMQPPAAKAQILAGAGTHFDPEIATAFVAMLGGVE